jgi:hypothetical protein
VDPEPLVTRDELTGIFFTITDISVGVKRIVELLEKDDNGEEEEDAP